ncbi:patatin-like phospholipase family protein [Agromyces sp. MMS24-K17]|uniref:patatin-like phospholipase family protein n=1 Tax=Agromyces sp. MMS24-K17 TaxID=3372850 RepID=UPI003753FFF3
MNLSASLTAHSTATDRLVPPIRTALVLGGGGSAGNAWLIGVVAGLHEAGLDVSDADLIIGTSAGSTAAAQITGAAPADLLADILAAPARPVGRPAARPAGAAGGPAPGRLTTDHLARMDAIIAASEDLADWRRRMGAALDADPASDDAASARWRATVETRLPGASWPERQRVQITAVDARTAEPVVFDRHSGVDLVDAVAASCAGGFAYRIGDRRYIDGGYRRNADNADLAAGASRVLVLSPLGGRSRTPDAWGATLASQVEELRAGGSEVETILPDGRSLSAFGDNMMNPATRPPAARAGYDQGRAMADVLGEFWR